MSTSGAAVSQMLDQAIDSARASRHGEAGWTFLQTLELIESTPDSPNRYQQLAKLAHSCRSAGHPDLALMALRGSLDSPKRKADPAKHCADLLTLANSWSGLGRAAAAKAANEAALACALDHHRWADAASANTNLAAQEANTDDLAAALERLQRSLEYLAKDDSNSDTDAVTRLTLLSVVDALGADPTIALDASAALFTRLRPDVSADRWGHVALAFHRLVERYLATHPEIDAKAWKRRTFPLVFGAGS